MGKYFYIVITSFFCFVSLAQYKQGDKVLINYQNHWYPGKILEVNGDKYSISYDEYDVTWNETVTKDRLKKNTEEAKSGQNNSASSGFQGSSSNSNSLKTTNQEDELAKKNADKMCECLKNFKKTGKKEDGSICLNLQEKQVAELGKGSEEYYTYQKLVSKCENEIMMEGVNNNAKTYEEKVKAVCDCMKKSAANREQKFVCMKLQDDYSKTVGDKKVNFIQETNMCQ